MAPDQNVDQTGGETGTGKLRAGNKRIGRLTRPAKGCTHDRRKSDNIAQPSDLAGP